MEFVFFGGAIILWTVLMKPRSVPFLALAGLSVLIPGYFLVATLIDPAGLVLTGNSIALLVSGRIVFGGLGIANFLLLMSNIFFSGPGFGKTALTTLAWGILLVVDVLTIGILLTGGFF